MKLRTVVVFALCIFPLSAQTTTPAKKLFAFFTSWSVYARNYHIPDVPVAKITHLVYAFAKIEAGKIALGDPYADTERFYPGDSWAPGALRGSFHRMQLMKQQHSHVKTLISIGGSGGSQGFSQAISTAYQRQVFANSIVEFLVLYDFDGADINWEDMGSTNPSDPVNLTLFLTELRQQLDARGQILNRTFLLTIDMPADPQQVAKYELAKVQLVVDAMLLMSFDYFVPIANHPSPVSHFNAPLYPVPGDPTGQPYSTDFNVARTIEVFRQAKVDAAKTILGMPLYGRGYEGISGGTNGLFAKYTGPTTAGTWGAGVFDYTDLDLNYVNKGGYVRYWDDAARVPRLYNPTAMVMISYDDPRSIREKAWLLRAHDLGGAMVWELSADRSAALLSEVERIVLRDPGLALATHEVQVSKPAAVSMSLDAGPSRKGKLYVLLGSLSGTYPGTPIAGSTFPLNIDGITMVIFGALNSPLFPATQGFLDANGMAKPGLGFNFLPSLPSNFVGQRLTLSAWVFDLVGGLSGWPSNAGDVFFRP